MMLPDIGEWMETFHKTKDSTYFPDGSHDCPKITVIYLGREN